VKPDACFTNNTVSRRSLFVAHNQANGTRVEDFMSSQKAIFVPGYGVTEAIRSIRLIPKVDSIGPAEPGPASSSQDSVTLEVWQGDRYGEPIKELLTAFSTSDRMATVYADGEMPLVRPSKSAVAIIRNAPDGYEIQFESEFIDPQDRAVRRTVTLDNNGTSRESLCELKSLVLLKSIVRRTGHPRPTASVARSLGRTFGRLGASISRFFRVPPSETSAAARHDIAVATGDIGLNRTAARLPSFTSQSFNDSGASSRTEGRPSELDVVQRAVE
jgi:hypothetical protein